MKADKPLYVIKFSNGQYWAGTNMFNPQLRFAVVYTSLKQIEKYAPRFLAMCWQKFHDASITYKAVEIEMKEKEL